jgi:CheY-like chemotaxis protein
MMGGCIMVDSDYGQGSVFTVIIPAVSGDKAKIKSAKNMGKEQVLYAPDATILIIDDNEFNLRVAEGMLSLFKINTKTAFSGKKAIDIIQNNEFDLVFMAHMMPEMDGVEAVEIIRKLGTRYESLPIIALTANAIQGAKEMFLSNGFNGFLSKPIEIQKLKEVLREWLPPEKIVEKELAAFNDESRYDKTSGDFISTLGEIDEIDTDIGLSSVSGVINIYYETLALFHRRLIAECDAMSAAINAKNIKSFAIKVHAIKSELSTIGAMNLSVAALKLETAAKTDDVSYCQELFPAFREKLINLYKNLSVVFPSVKAKTQKKDGDTNYLQEKISEALEAADDFNGDSALKITTELLIYDFGNKNNILLENAAAAFENYDYNAARESLNKVSL